MTKSFLEPGNHDAVFGSGGTGTAKIAGKGFSLPISTKAGAGTTITDATAISNPVTYVSSGSANSGVKLPDLVIGAIALVVNNAGVEIDVYPHNALGYLGIGSGAGDPYILHAGAVGMFVRVTAGDAGIWATIAGSVAQ